MRPIDVLVTTSPRFPVDLMWDEPNLVQLGGHRQPATITASGRGTRAAAVTVCRPIRSGHGLPLPVGLRRRLRSRLDQGSWCG
jgi:hypothetical protein